MALDPQSVTAILKGRCARAGLDPVLFSAHGLRSGFMTEAGKQGVAVVRGDAIVAAPLGAAGGALL